MTTPRTLLSLNEDILREILAHLLLDTPPERNRASILRTCTLLHELGLPLLYRVVDLRGFKTGHILLEHWRRLFGEGGFLIEGGGRDELARTVKEMRVGGEPPTLPSILLGGDQQDLAADAAKANFTIQKVSLPACSQLLVNLFHYEGALQTLLGPLISQLPVTQLQLHYNHEAGNQSKTFQSRKFPPSVTLTSSLFGLSSSRCPWDDLHTVSFDEHLWCEFNIVSAGIGTYLLSSSNWSFKVLVFEVTPKSSFTSTEALEFNRYLRPRFTNHLFLVDTERIELRTKGPVARKFEEALRKTVGEDPLDASHRRILDLVVFVGEDGKERRLTEGLE